MINAFFGNSIWQLITQADVMTKFVLITLLLLSIGSWTILLYKIVGLRLKRKELDAIADRLKAIADMDQLLLISAEFAKTLPGYFLTHNLTFLKSVLQRDGQPKAQLSESEWERMQYTMDQTITDIVHHEERYLPYLATVAAVAPLLGLFGTVWGLVHSFISISEKQSADITTVAPGLAEALITTLAGLLVAIPALIMYHYLMVQVRALEHKLVGISDQLSWLIQSLFVL